MSARLSLVGVEGIRTSAFPTLSFAVGEPMSHLGPLRRRDEPRLIQAPGEVYDWNHDSDWCGV